MHSDHTAHAHADTGFRWQTLEHLSACCIRTSSICLAEKSSPAWDLLYAEQAPQYNKGLSGDHVVMEFLNVISHIIAGFAMQI